MPTQVDMLIHHFANRDSISPMEAHNIYKIRSLPRRILDLKERGFTFRSEWHTDLTGQRYKRYFIVSAPASDDAQTEESD